jgi:signal transduction histidine kinase
VDEGGDVSAAFKPSQSADEIGQLSRNYGSLLEQIRGHNDYLKTLAQKLSHEMRTPLAIVSTSLDNLSSDNETKIYLERARDGVHRLSYIMTSMGQAKKIEEAIQYSEFEILDVRQLITDVCKAYGKIYQQHKVVCNPPEHVDKIVINGSGELLIQMLDKLVDNALDFSPSGSTITVALEQDKKQVRIKVINTGPLLADGNNEALFQQLVTYRDNSDEKTHLGLGLFITRLIAEHHGGTVTASNLTDKSGVSFCVSLPR